MNQFFIDLLKRFAADTPWFFKVLQIISVVIGVVLVAPDILNAIQEGGFTLPDTWGKFVAKAVGWAGIAQAFILQLTTTSADKAQKGIKD